MSDEWAVEEAFATELQVEESNTPYVKGSIPYRTKVFALRIIKVSEALQATRTSRHFADQLLRAGTSVGAHLHEAKRSRSDSEMISKVAVALQELDETDYWISIIIGAKLITAERLSPIQSEIQELIAILTTASKTLKARKHSHK